MCKCVQVLWHHKHHKLTVLHLGSYVWTGWQTVQFKNFQICMITLCLTRVYRVYREYSVPWCGLFSAAFTEIRRRALLQFMQVTQQAVFWSKQPLVSLLIRGLMYLGLGRAHACLGLLSAHPSLSYSNSPLSAEPWLLLTPRSSGNSSS